MYACDSLTLYIFLIIDCIFSSLIFYFPSLHQMLISTHINNYIYFNLHISSVSEHTVLNEYPLHSPNVFDNFYFCSDLKNVCCLVLGSSCCLLFHFFISIALNITFTIATCSYWLVHWRGRQINAFQRLAIYQPVLLAVWLEGKADTQCLEITMLPTIFLIPFNIGVSILTFPQHTTSFFYWYHTSKHKEAQKRSLFHPKSDQRSGYIL